ncbi:MAG: neutral/alkaline non-lysosomal ceramidase N-terminal domain-containing protein [Trueperaceae bacterium]
MMSQALRAGVGRAVINPPLGVVHAGWGAATHVHATGFHMDLYATVLVLRSDDGALVFCDLDLCLIPNEVDKRVREAVAAAAGVDVNAVRLSMSHTHGGPEVQRSYASGAGSLAEAYLENLVHLVAGAAKQANDHLEPAVLTFGSGQANFAINRRQKLPEGRVVTGCNPEGFADHSLPLLRIDSAAGGPLACMWGYAMHPTILGPENTLMSPDYPGVARSILEELTGATSLFLQGSAGNQGPGPGGFTGDLHAAERIGSALGCEASKVYLSSEDLGVAEFDRVWESGAPLGKWKYGASHRKPAVLGVRNRLAMLPVKPAPSLSESTRESQELREKLVDLREDGAPAGEIESLTWRTKRAEMRVRHAREYEGLTEKGIEVQAFRVGETAFVAMPLEPFAEIGMRIKERSPFRLTHVSGYSNGWYGYLPTSESYLDGGYEVDTTPFQEGADEVMVRVAAEMLAELATER